MYQDFGGDFSNVSEQEAITIRYSLMVVTAIRSGRRSKEIV